MPDTVAAYRGRYEALKGRLDGKRDAAIGKAVGVYRGELELLLTNVRQQGKLDYVVAIQGELKRLETDPTAPKKPAAKRMKHLRRAQGGARVAEDQAVEAHGKALAELRKGYSSSLRSLEKRLVAANEIEEAKLARSERSKIPKPVRKPKVEGKPVEKPDTRPELHPANIRITDGPKGHSLVRMRNGATLKTDGSKVANCPTELAKWKATKSAGTKYSRYRIDVKRAGYVLVAIHRKGYIAGEWHGWVPTGMSFNLGEHDAPYTILRTEAEQGELRTPQISRAYPIVLVPPPQRR